MQTVPGPLLEKYFTLTYATYLINRQIRDMVVFAQHDLIQDPPFTRLDIVSCRNVLIYFKRVMQEQLLSTFHYILNPGGYLVLGSSESLGKYEDVFEQADKTRHVFQCREAGEQSMTFPRPHYFAAILHTKDVSAPVPRSCKQVFEQMLLEQYAPVGVLLDARAEVVYVAGDVSRLLQLRPGEINVNVIDMVISALRLDVRIVLRNAMVEKTIAHSKAVELPASDGGTQV